MANPATPAFLTWLADRLVVKYGESENVDFVRRVRHEAAKAQTLRTSLSANKQTYVLAKTTGPEREDGMHGYVLVPRGHTDGEIASRLWLTAQQADDLARQLDAGVDYFSD